MRRASIPSPSLGRSLIVVPLVGKLMSACRSGAGDEDREGSRRPYAHFVYLRTMLLNCRASDVMDKHEDTDFMITEDMDSEDDDDSRFTELTD